MEFSSEPKDMICSGVAQVKCNVGFDIVARCLCTRYCMSGPTELDIIYAVVSHYNYLFLIQDKCIYCLGRVLLKILGGGVLHGSQNPDPISD